jgi:ankyrin repeat protein
LQEEEENAFEARGRRYRAEKESELLQSVELHLTLGHADSKAENIDGATPLHGAIKARNPLIVETLIRLSPSDIIIETDSKGQSPLHWAAEAGFTQALYYLVDTSSPVWTAFEFRYSNEGENLMKAMQESVNVVDKFGNTALHYAAKNSHEKFVAKLFSFSKDFVNIDIRNYEGCTALDLAIANNQVWLVRAFKELAEILKVSRCRDIWQSSQFVWNKVIPFAWIT